MKTTDKKKNQFLLKQKCDSLHTESHINEPKDEFITLSWNKDNTDIKSFIRGGKINLGCGWCGHSSPEG